GAIKAVSNISLQIKRNQVLGLIGPNGAGKTTLVNCISGFLLPTSGVVRLDDQSVGNWSPELARKKGVARTFQGGRLFQRLSVLDNVVVAGVALGMSQEGAQDEANQLLEWVGYRGDLWQPAASVP